MRFATVAWLTLGLAPLAQADDGLPPAILDRVKEATVFVKVGSGALQRSGSGFLFLVDGNVGLVATNEHVVAPLSREDLPRTEVAVVFHSGQKGELTADGTVVAVDKESDLAIVRVRGVKNFPKPLSVLEPAELRETMSVYAAGFPFGAALSLTKGNPAVSLNRGSISSLRRNAKGELARIQIEGSLHPGNSGGPVVDKDGRLAGVAVARVSGSNLSIAVPPNALTGMLEGRAERVELRVRKVVNGVAELEVSVRLVDPLDKLSKVSVRVARNDAFEEFKTDKDGTWPPLRGSEVVDLQLADQLAKGTVVLKSDEKAVVYFSFQPVLVRADKAQVHGRPSDPFRVDYRSNTAANLPTAPFRSKAIETTAKASPDWIFKEARRGATLFSDSDYVFADVPDEIKGGTLLVRKSAERKVWLEPHAISALADGSVYAIFRSKRLGKDEVSEVTLTKLEREGWAEVQGPVETTFPDGEDWRWTALRKSVKKGEVVLQLKTVRWPDAPVLFVFKEGQ